MPGRPVGWYWTNSMSLQRHPRPVRERHAVAGVDVPLVVNGKTLAGAAGREDHAAAGTRGSARCGCRSRRRRCTRRRRPGAPSRSTRRSGRCARSTQRGLEQRVQHVEADLVGREPRARYVMPPKARTRRGRRRLPAPRTAPVLELDQLLGASWTKYSTASWSPRKSLPLTVSKTCSSRLSSSRDDAGRAALGGHGVAAHRIDLRDHCDVGVSDRSRRSRWRRAGRRRRLRRRARRVPRPGPHSPRSSWSTRTLPWWSTTRRWTLPSWNSSLALGSHTRSAGPRSAGLAVLGVVALTLVQVPARRERCVESE